MMPSCRRNTWSSAAFIPSQSALGDVPLGAADVITGLVVGVGRRLQQLWVGLNVHDNHLIDGYQSFKA